MSHFVYPRLPLPYAEARISEITKAMVDGGISGVQAMARAEHPRAAPVATGGRVASSEYIASVRTAVLATIEPWRRLGTVPRPQAAAFDLTLGRTLHEHLRIIPADAAHDETWSFLTLVVFPDVAVSRFPDMHADRLIGTPRNVLRRTWFREEVLGDLLHSTDRPLGEDELVGLFERSALARNHALIRRLAVAVLAYDGPAARSEWARDLYKRVTFTTGPRLLDALSDAELDAIIYGNELALGHTPATRNQQALSPLVGRLRDEYGLAVGLARFRWYMTANVRSRRASRGSRFCDRGGRAGTVHCADRLQPRLGRSLDPGGRVTLTSTPTSSRWTTGHDLVAGLRVVNFANLNQPSLEHHGSREPTVMPSTTYRQTGQRGRVSRMRRQRQYGLRRRFVSVDRYSVAN